MDDDTYPDKEKLEDYEVFLFNKLLIFSYEELLAKAKDDEGFDLLCFIIHSTS